jgi:hypothetical protein
LSSIDRSWCLALWEAKLAKPLNTTVIDIPFIILLGKFHVFKAL